MAGGIKTKLDAGDAVVDFAGDIADQYVSQFADIHDEMLKGWGFIAAVPGFKNSSLDTFTGDVDDLIKEAGSVTIFEEYTTAVEDYRFAQEAAEEIIALFAKYKPLLKPIPLTAGGSLDIELAYNEAFFKKPVTKDFNYTGLVTMTDAYLGGVGSYAPSASSILAELYNFTAELKTLKIASKGGFGFLPEPPAGQSFSTYLNGIYQKGLDKLLSEDKTVEDEIARLEAILAARKKGGVLLNSLGRLFTGTTAELEAELAKLKGALAAGTAAASVSRATAELLIYRQQCFLLANLDNFIKLRQESPNALPLPYAKADPNPLNHPILIQGSPFPFLNKVVIDSKTKALFNMHAEQMSFLTPRMRFFKVEKNEKTGKDEEIEITFDTNANRDISAYLEKNNNAPGSAILGRGVGVGVKGFTFSYVGTDPFSVKKAITAKLDIYAPSFSDLLADRTAKVIGSKTRRKKYKYVDLALKTGRASEQVAKKFTLTEEEKENLEKLNFRIRVLVELTADNKGIFTNAGLDRGEDVSALNDAVYNSAISIYLTPTIHEFDFDEAGGVTFSINYLAYIEDYFATPNFDIFGSNARDRIVREMCIDYFKEKDCNSKEIEEFEKADALYISQRNARSLQTIIDKLMSKNKLYYYGITREKMKMFIENPREYLLAQNFTESIKTSKGKTPPVAGAAAAATKKAGGATATTAAKTDYLSSMLISPYFGGQESIKFFYLSDLISVVLELIENTLQPKNYIDPPGAKPASTGSGSYYDGVVRKNFKGASDLKSAIEKKVKEKDMPNVNSAYEQLRKLRIVLGPVEVTPFSMTNSTKEFIEGSLGDIPISLNYFISFMSEKILSNSLVEYPLSKFISNLIKDCMKNFLNSDDCFASNASQKLSLSSTTVLAYNKEEAKRFTEDDLSDFIFRQSVNYKKKGTGAAINNCLILDKVTDTHIPLLDISGPRDDPRKDGNIKDMRNYYIFSVGRSKPAEKFKGRKNTDEREGIFHYTLGEDKGIVKTISLDKTNTPGLKELRFEQEGFSGLTQLREVYNANISTFLNVQTFPGTYIYITPKGFDPKATEDLSRFGIGGYYMITKTTHTIQPGNAETQINAAWVASKGDVVREKNGTSSTATASKTDPSKCKVIVRKSNRS